MSQPFIRIYTLLPALYLQRVAYRIFVDDHCIFSKQALRFVSYVLGPVQLVCVRQLVVPVLLVTEVYSPQPAVGVHLDADRLHVGCLEWVTCDCSQIQVQLVPTLIHAKWHRDHERAQLFDRMVVAHAYTPANVLAVQNLYLHTTARAGTAITRNREKSTFLSVERYIFFYYQIYQFKIYTLIKN